MTNASTSLKVVDIVTADNGADLLSSVEQLKFSDVTLVFDLTPAQDKLVYELFQAAFLRAPDKAGLNSWISVANSGTPRDNLLVSFATSGENLSLIAAHGSNAFWTI